MMINSTCIRYVTSETRSQIGHFHLPAGSSLKKLKSSPKNELLPVKRNKSLIFEILVIKKLGLSFLEVLEILWVSFFVSKHLQVIKTL